MMMMMMMLRHLTWEEALDHTSHPQLTSTSTLFFLTFSDIFSLTSRNFDHSVTFATGNMWLMQLVYLAGWFCIKHLFTVGGAWTKLEVILFWYWFGSGPESRVFSIQSWQRYAVYACSCHLTMIHPVGRNKRRCFPPLNYWIHSHCEADLFSETEGLLHNRSLSGWFLCFFLR